MKTLTKILLGATLLTSCELPDINLDLADVFGDTTKVIVGNDTIIIIKDSVVYSPDTFYLPIDTIQNGDSIEIIKDTIIQEIPKDTTIYDTTIYTPKFHDENIFIDFENKSYLNGNLFDYFVRIKNLTDKTISFTNDKSDPAIKYTLYKDDKVVFSEVLNDKFNVELYKNGYFGISKKDGLSDFILSGGKYTDTKSYIMPYPVEVLLTKESKNYYFESTGIYNFEVDLRYFVDGSRLENKFYSERFEVR